jgi:hypothetical protein
MMYGGKHIRRTALGGQSLVDAYGPTAEHQPP